MSDICSRVINFIIDEILPEDASVDLSVDTELLGSIVDSMDLFLLVAYIEEKFAVSIEDLEVTETNFRTVREVERLVTRKKRHA